MALPTPPAYTTPIPNNPFYSVPSYLVQGAYSPYVVGAGLFVSPSGTISSTGGGGGAVASIVGGAGIGVSSPTGNVTLTNTGVTSLIAGSGITLSGNTGNITISATAASGTVTAVNTGTGLTGGPIITTGTIALANTGVAAATYTNPTLTVNAQGQITAASSGTAVSSVVGTAPITVSTALGTATVGISAATTAACGAVQLSDSTSSLSSATAATSLAVKTAFDVAVAAIPKTCITAKGSLVTGTGAGIPTALSVGADGQVLVADSGCAEGIKWGTASSVPAATPTVLGTVKGCVTATEAGLGCNAFGDGAGNSNVYLGYNAGCNAQGGTGAVFIGACAGNGPIALNWNCSILIGCNVQNQYLGSGVGLVGRQNLAIGYGNNIWLAGSDDLAIKPGAGIIDCASSCGTANMVLTSQGNAIEWKSVNSAIAAPNYGSFYDTTTQVNTVGTGTGRPITLSTTDSANNFSIVSGSQITAAAAGTYNLQFSAQFETTTASLQTIEIWLSINGTSVLNSNTEFTTKGSGEAYFAALNYVFNMNPGDYAELIWASGDANMALTTHGSTYGGPQIPSMIVTIVPVGA